MNKKQAEEMTSELMMADALLRITALEKILINKGIFTKEEFNDLIQEISAQIAKKILESANFNGDIDKIISELIGKSKISQNN